MTLFDDAPRAPTDARLICYDAACTRSIAFTRAVRRGELLRLRPGVYMDRAEWGAQTPWERYRLTVLAEAASDADAVMCRDSGLLIHGLPLIETPEFVTTRARLKKEVGRQRSALVSSGVPLTRRIEAALARDVTREAHRVGMRSGGVTLPTEQVRQPAGAGGETTTINADPLMLNLIDTVPRMGRDAGVVALDAAMRLWRAEGSVLDDGLWLDWRDHLRPRRHEGIWRSAWEFADPRAQSPGESISRLRLQDAGFPAPVLQKRFDVEGRGLIVDFWWEEFGVIVEFDGLAKYRAAEFLRGRETADVVIDEKEREDLLRSTGARVVRWGWSDLWRFSRVAERLLRAGLLREHTGRR